MEEQALHSGRKRIPKVETETTPERDKAMDIEGKNESRMQYRNFGELPSTITFYLTDIYAFGLNLFLTGIMPNGQTMNLVATQPAK